MPTDEQARLLRTAPSTAIDGLDLTVAEARAMSRELFKRTFDVASLDDVPLVGPGFLERAPRDCKFYVRFRPAPKNPKPKDRKADAMELVVKVPQRAEPEAGGGIAVNPKRYVLSAKEPDAARLEALVFLARKSGRRIRASTWPVERVESLSAFDLLESYIGRKLGPAPEGVSIRRGKAKTRETYRYACRAFQRAFPETEIGDLKGDWIADEYERRTGRSPRSRFADLRTVRMALHSELAMLGTEDYEVGFANPDPGRLQKRPWTPEEYDRVLRAADRWILAPDGTPLGRRALSDRGAWKRGIEFLPYTASRPGRLPLIRWVPPWVEPADGLPLPVDDRPWIEVTEEGPIYFHRDGEVPYKGNKRRAGNVVPVEFAPTVREWFEEDAAAGIEFVFHRKGGRRYESLHIGNWTFRQIIADAGLPPGRMPKNFKDLAVEWADAARMRRETLAAHASTRSQTLASTYGEELRTALLEEAADAMAQTGWRKKAARRAGIAQRFAGGRARATEAKSLVVESSAAKSSAAKSSAAKTAAASERAPRRGGRVGARGAN